MKYRDENGDFQDLYLKTGDTLPIGTEVDYDGDTAPAGWEALVDPNSYSLNEVKTNKTWIDGKPIYRKVVEVGILSATESQQDFTVINSNVAMLIDAKAIMLSKNYATNGIMYTLPKISADYSNASPFCNIDWITQQTSLILKTYRTSAVWYESNSIICIVEYTKTTD